MKLITIFFLLLAGCAIPTTSDIQKMTPDQMQAYKDVGVFPITAVCGGGPPGAGQLTFVTIPIRSKGKIRIDASCHPDIEVTIDGDALGAQEGN